MKRLIPDNFAVIISRNSTVNKNFIDIIQQIGDVISRINTMT